MRFQRIVQPTLPGLSVAPITAMLWGAKEYVERLALIVQGIQGRIARAGLFLGHSGCLDGSFSITPGNKYSL